MTIYHRLVISLLLVFALVAYIDTKSLKERIDDSKVLREYKQTSKLIGIGVREIEDKIKVHDVIFNTPAQKSGIEVGDIVVNIDGNTVDSTEMLSNYLRDVEKNKKIALTIQKPNNKIIEVSLTPVSITNYE